MGVIYYNGQCSTDFGIIVEDYPAINHGARRGEGYQIAGRNGTFYPDEMTYNNYVQSYNIAIREKNRGAAARCGDIAAWLMAASTPSGFLRLEDTFEPEFYKMARYAGPLNIEQIMGRYGRCTLEFECQPERWLKSGQDPITASSSSLTIHNPTLYRAKPLITVVRTAASTVKIGNDAFFEVGYTSSLGSITIDCEKGTIYSGSTNMYGATTFSHPYNDFPTLRAGDTTLTVTNATSITVVPRWYVL